MRTLLIGMLIVFAASMLGCKEDKGTGGAAQGTGASGGTPATAVAPTAPEHNRIPMGETTVGSLKLVATTDGPVQPGGEGAFDLVITGGKPKAVRFWVGVEGAQGSVKAKAEEETPDNWHTHAEVPNPLPAGSKFWAEVEPPTGVPFKVSFDLKVK